MATREQRIRERLFPDVTTFDRSGGFTTLPLVLRTAQFLFNPRAWQVYTYILMRTGPHGVAWFSLSEMAHDLDFKSVAKLKPYVDDLIEQGWLRRSSSRGRDYYVAPDPVGVLRKLAHHGKLVGDRLDAVDELLEALNQEPIVPATPSVPTEEAVHPRLPKRKGTSGL